MPDRPIAIISETLEPVCQDWLAERCDVRKVAFDAPEFDAGLREAHALVVRTYTQVNRDLLAKTPKLKVVGRAGVGLDNVDLDACRERGIQVVYTPDANTQAVVEYVIGLMLDHFRPRSAMPARCDSQTFHALRKTEIGKQLDQMTLGILGFGRIGKKLVRVAHAIGMNLLVNDLLPEADMRKAVDFPFSYVDLPTLCRDSDILTVHVDGRPANKHLINRDVLNLLKPDCLFINAARGMLVDHDALADWLKANAPIGGYAILDVHEPEPPTPELPLWDLPNVKLLPHIASRTGNALENMSWVVRDVWAVLEGRQPKYAAE